MDLGFRVWGLGSHKGPSWPIVVCVGSQLRVYDPSCRAHLVPEECDEVRDKTSSKHWLRAQVVTCTHKQTYMHRHTSVCGNALIHAKAV